MISTQRMEFPTNVLVPAGACVAGCVVGGLIMKKIIQTTSEPDQLPEKWTKVGQIRNLLIYPVKGMPGVSVNAAVIQGPGFTAADNSLLRDRVFLIMNDTGKSVGQGKYPMLALTRVKVEGNQLHLSHVNDQSLNLVIDIPNNDDASLRKLVDLYGEKITGIDCGDAVSTWLTKVTGASCLRMLYHLQEDTQRSSVKRNRRFHTYRGSHAGTFQDETSYMLMTDESVAALNLRLDKPVSHTNFRPNITVSGIPEPFAEDFWGFIRIGDRETGPVLKTSLPCIRCTTTTVDPETGTFREDGEPLRTLYKMKRPVGDEKTTKLISKSAIMGAHFGVFEGIGKVVQVGDPIYAALV